MVRFDLLSPNGSTVPIIFLRFPFLEISPDGEVSYVHDCGEGAVEVAREPWLAGVYNKHVFTAPEYRS